jgi:hypothetical protein
MSLATAQLLVDAFQLYLVTGAVFAVMFLWKWVRRLDPLAAQGTLGFRLLVFPGVTALWPLFVVRLIRGVSAPPEEWTAHRVLTRNATGTMTGAGR